MGLGDFIKGAAKIVGGVGGIACPKCGSFNVDRCKEDKDGTKGRCFCNDCFTEWKCIARSTDPKCKDDCYITTATLTALNKCDDKCYELETFRWYRDNILLKEEPDGKALVEEYYKTAPLIVEKIENSPEREKVYKHLWEHYLKPCLEAIEKREYKKVKELYVSMVRNLQKKYLK